MIAENKIQSKKDKKQQIPKNPKNVELKKQKVKAANIENGNQKQSLGGTAKKGPVASTNKKSKKVKKSEIKKTVRKSPFSQNGLLSIKTKVPKAYPYELTVEVSKLPNGYKQINVIEVFSKYGHITYFQRVSGKKAIVAFLKEEEAAAAIKASRVEKIGNQVLTVRKRVKKIKETDENAQRTVFVFRVSRSTTEDDIRKHFETCGEISSVKCKQQFSENYFIIEFGSAEAGKAALKLHNSNLKDSTIAVRLQSNRCVPWYPTRTIMLFNKDGLKQIEGSTIASIFSQCGEIENCDVLCSQHKLAILTFKSEADVAKALELNGKKINGLTVAVASYFSELQRNSVPPKVNPHAEKLELAKDKKRKVYVKNIPSGTTEEHLTNFFKSCGAVKKVSFVNESQAVVEFNDYDGYCRAFVLHTHPFMGNKLYLLPFTENISEKTAFSGKRPTSNRNEPPKKLKKIK